jgi:polyhydroxyalkanoate synthesis regulator protein
MAIFERAMRIFSPFGAPMGQAGEAERKPEDKTPDARERELDSLKERLEAMQRQLDALSGKR